jgi:hypothetical protein
MFKGISMKLYPLLCLWLLLSVVTVASAEEKNPQGGDKVKALSGMSIVGNDEAPKSLYLVPWKSSAIAVETDLSMPAQKGYTPVDREEFKRKLDYYDISSKRNTGR